MSKSVNPEVSVWERYRHRTEQKKNPTTSDYVKIAEKISVTTDTNKLKTTVRTFPTLKIASSTFKYMQTKFDMSLMCELNCFSSQTTHNNLYGSSGLMKFNTNKGTQKYVKIHENSRQWIKENRKKQAEKKIQTHTRKCENINVTTIIERPQLLKRRMRQYGS